MFLQIVWISVYFNRKKLNVFSHWSHWFQGSSFPLRHLHYKLIDSLFYFDWHVLSDFQFECVCGFWFLCPWYPRGQILEIQNVRSTKRILQCFNGVQLCVCLCVCVGSNIKENMNINNNGGGNKYRHAMIISTQPRSNCELILCGSDIAIAIATVIVYEIACLLHNPHDH